MNEFKLDNTETEILKIQLSKVFKARNEENRTAVTAIKANISKKESDIEQVEYNYALAADPNKQGIMEKALTKLQTEKAEMEAELERVSKEILNLDDFMEYSLTLRSNIFRMWDIVDLGDKRRLQNLIFPKGIVYDKETARIEPREVNRLFVAMPCESEQTVEKESEQTDKNINLSALAPRLGLEPRTP